MVRLHSKVAAIQILIVGCLSVLLALAFQKDARAQVNMGQNVLGWCTVTRGPEQCFSSPEAACEKQRSEFNPTAIGYPPFQSDAWYGYNCAWCNGQYCSGTAPASTVFRCADETRWARVSPGMCLPFGEPYRPPPSCHMNGGQRAPETGYPIVILNGSKSFSAVDYRSSNGSLSLVRSYATFKDAGFGARLPLGIDRNWSFGFQREIVISTDFWYYKRMTLTMANGSVVDFIKLDDGSIVAAYDDYIEFNANDYKLEYLDAWPADLNQVKSSKPHWRLTDPEGTVWLFEGVFTQTGDYRISRPTSMQRLNAGKLTFTYGNLAELQTISDEFGQTLTFTWNLSPAAPYAAMTTSPVSIASVLLPDGRKLKYAYDAEAGASAPEYAKNRLVKVETLSAADVVLSTTRYVFEDTRFPFAITGIYDSRDVRTNTVSYDQRGRAISSELAGGVEKTTVAYGDPNTLYTLQRTVTNALGKQTVFNYSREYQSRPWLFSGIDGLASASCAAGTRNVTYDANRSVIAETDEEGRVTTYQRDSLGRVVSMTRGAGGP